MSQEVATVKKRAPARKKAALPAAPVTQEQQITNALMQSIESGVLQPEQLEMVLNAQERILDRQAKQSFFSDMAHCQAEIPVVMKNKTNLQTSSRYEDIESLNNVIKPVYTKWGFAVSFNSMPAAEEGNIGMKATVSHKDGWFEDHTIELPLDTLGIKGNVNKTKIHGTASSRSYCRRYLLREIFNITTTEDIDDDAQSVIETLDEKEIANIEALLTELGINEADFLKVAKHDSIADIPRNRYHAAIQWLEARRDIQQ